MLNWKYRPDLATVLLVVVVLAVFFIMTIEVWLPHDFR